MSIAVTNPAHAARPAAAPGVARTFHLGLVGLMLAIVLAGFWPYFSALPFGTGAHWILHLHAAVFSGWMLLYLAQVWLVYRRQVRTHQALGRFGIYYGVPTALLVWLSPLFLAMAHDALTARRVDRTYVIGLAILLAGVSRVGLMESELWLPTGRAIVQFFTGPAT